VVVYIVHIVGTQTRICTHRPCCHFCITYGTHL